MDLDLDRLSLREAIQLQNELTAAMTRRFQRRLALGFSDVVGSTAYFKHFGDVAGRALLQRHIDLLQRVLSGAGRIVDTAGDGAFICFDSMDAAAAAVIALERSIDQDNRLRPAEQRLSVRVGLHFGAVLADNEVVSGDAVNVCARIASTSAPREVRLSREAYQELSPAYRIYCQHVPPVTVKGVSAPLQLMTFEWVDPAVFPTLVTVDETGERIALPDQPTITFGRLSEVQRDGTKANDIVLALPDARQTERISRWHFELHRKTDGFTLRSLSDKPTVVDGREVPYRGEAPVLPGSVVKLSGVITLLFTREEEAGRFMSTLAS
jgi:class 3 adenylate cyclase